MFSKTIFKQTLKSNFKLWAIFTVILSVFGMVIIRVFNPDTMSGMLKMLENSPIADMIGDGLSEMTSLVSMLANNFYGMIAVILPLIYIIITANGLIAAQVDKGSMAYTLSTPIKRSKVVFTQGLFLVVSLLVMVGVLTLSGLASVQMAHGGVFKTAYPADVVAIAEMQNTSEQEIEDNLYQVIGNAEAIKIGAEARGIGEDVYTSYIENRVLNKALSVAADKLGVDADAIRENPGLLLSSEEALSAAANAVGVDADKMREDLETVLGGQEDNTDQLQEMQNNLTSGLAAAAEVLGIDATELSGDMALLKTNEAAMNAMVTTSGLSKETVISLVNTKLAGDELAHDEGINFGVKAYLMLNLGLFLLLFAISSISFASSCIFNLTQNALALGAGIPVASFLFKMMSQTSNSLSGFKYLSLNTLFDTSAIASSGNYAIQFVVLAVIGIALYILGMQWFQKKDLPL